MATLTLKIATLTASATATDANAQAILEAAFALFHQNDYELVDGQPTTTLKVYTSQEKLTWIVQTLIPMMLVDKAKQFSEMQLIKAAQLEATNTAVVFE